MDEAASTTTVGLVGPTPQATAAVRTAGFRPVTGDAADVLAADPDLVVTVGETALLAVAHRRPDPPLLPVDATLGVATASVSTLGETLSALGTAAVRTCPHPLLGVTADGERVGTALFDATLVSGVPARISAFRVSAGGDSVGSVRADGVVVATPAGTAGYAARLDAPRIEPGTGVLAVEPISQFTTHPERWVLPDAEVTVTVERDDVPVDVLADDRVVATVDRGDQVSIVTDGSVETVVGPPGSTTETPPDTEVEKH